MRTRLLRNLLAVLLPAAIVTAAPVTTTDELLAAVAGAGPGAVIQLAEGTFRLAQALDLKGGITLKGAGMDKTTVTHTESWKPSTKALPDPEMRLEGLDTDAYLIRIQRDAQRVTLSDMTLHAPHLHGAVFAWFPAGLHLHHLRIKDTLWCGVRTFGMKNAKIHDCEFVNAGGRWEKGMPGLKGGITGGGLFACWMADTEVWNNRFLETRSTPNEHYYGIKVRQAKRCRIHHNTIEVNFSLELPFENDEDVEIGHNICHGTISIPKHAGGPVPKSGSTFHIHHNYFRDTYAIEFVRNGVEIDHNLFDFARQKDHGNLISAFGNAPAPGPASFHNNLVSNPGRGVIWMNEPYGKLEVRNNHIIARTTKEPRTEGLFGFNEKSGFAEFRFADNIIACEGTPRPLFRNDASGAAVIENNRLENITDTARYGNKATGRPQGPEQPLTFQCGAYGEMTVDGWKTSKTQAQPIRD
jgi:nitrous oxidase accessory protein